MEKNIIFCGPGTAGLAEEEARKCLCLEDGMARCTCESCANGIPDLLTLAPSEDGGILGVEQALSVSAWAELKPSVSRRRAVLIHGINRMTVPAQNKLLKLMEDSETAIIADCPNLTDVLPTIQSRSAVKTARALTPSEFHAKNICKEEDEEILYALTCGCPEMLLLFEADVAFYRKIKEILLKEDCSELIPALGLLKEKDAKNFFSRKKRQVYNLFCLMEKILSDKILSLPQTNSGQEQRDRLRKMLRSVSRSKEFCETQGYDANSFFCSIMSIITF